MQTLTNGMCGLEQNTKSDQKNLRVYKLQMIKILNFAIRYKNIGIGDFVFYKNLAKF